MIARRFCELACGARDVAERVVRDADEEVVRGEGQADAAVGVISQPLLLPLPEQVQVVGLKWPTFTPESMEACHDVRVLRDPDSRAHAMPECVIRY